MQKTAIDCAISYLAARDRTKAEMIQHLKDKRFDPSEISSAIIRLEDLGFINDEKFADGFVHSRLAVKPHSKNDLRRQLLVRKVPEPIVQVVIDRISDDSDFENALSVTRKFFRQFHELDPELRRRRILTRLQSRGYSYAVSQRALESVEYSTDNKL